MAFLTSSERMFLRTMSHHALINKNNSRRSVVAILSKIGHLLDLAPGKLTVRIIRLSETADLTNPGKELFFDSQTRRTSSV